MKKILIADDEKAIGKALSLKLNSVGFETVLVYDGEAVLSALRESKFDLIILDLVMPKKDGFYVLSELKKMQLPTPVIVASNLSQEEDVNRAKTLGASGYFVKSDQTLSEIVDKVKLFMT